MPRADRLSPGGVKLLLEKQIAILSTVMKDGSPQATPVWVDVEPDGTHVLINTAEGRIKTNNVARDPRVADLINRALDILATDISEAPAIRKAIELVRLKARPPSP